MPEDTGLTLVELQPADVLLYFDPSSSKPVDDGLNQVAIVIDERHALLVEPRPRDLPISRLPELQKLRVQRPIEDAATAKSVADYFLKHRKSAAYLDAGFRALLQQNYKFFADGPFPNKPHYQDQAAYDAAWQTRVCPIDGGFS